jgi:hypothetical protein
VITGLQEDVNTPLGQTLFEAITGFSRSSHRRTHQDIRVFILINGLRDLNRSFWTELLHKQGKLWSAYGPSFD